MRRGSAKAGVQPVGSPLTSHLNGVWLSATAVALLALAVRLVHLDAPAHIDELYHVLAARSWLAEGEFNIAEGTYSRASFFTALVGTFFAFFGATLEVARLPSVLAGTILVILVFVWTRAVAGTAAATIAALLLALAPEAIATSQFARFYALHALLFWLGAIGVYALVDRPRPVPQVLALLLGVLGCFLLAQHLQPITLIGLGGVGLWVMIAAGLPWLGALRDRPLKFWAALGGLAVGAVVVLAFVVMSSLGAELLARYRSTALWNEATRNAFWYYHRDLSVDYPTLWPLVPVAALVALATRPRPAGFCLCIFAAAFLVHSFAAAKSPRYLQYAMPFFFVLWGIALARLLATLRRFVAETAADAVAPLPRLRRAAAAALIGASLLFVVFANGATVKTVAHLAGITVPPLEPPVRWDAVPSVLSPWLDDETVVVTTRELHGLYYLGRYDIALSRSRLGEVGGAEFGPDPRTGRPVIGSAEALARVMDCFPRGLIILPEYHWRDPAQLDAPVADLIVRRAEEIALPRRLRIRAWHWQDPSPATTDRCSDIPALAGRPGGDG